MSLVGRTWMVVGVVRVMIGRKNFSERVLHLESAIHSPRLKLIHVEVTPADRMTELW